jgi:hypothetical protein
VKANQGYIEMEKIPAIIDASIMDERVEFIDTTGLRLEGNHRDEMSFEVGLSYLRSYQDGTLHHPDMEDLNYLFIRDKGEVAYLDFAKQEVEIVRDLTEFSEANDWSPTWYYMPGFELSVVVDGTETFERAKTQDPINPVENLPFRR